MNTSSKKITPEYVERLSKCEIFVFGSNLEGQHMGGAAKTAYEKFGAEWGVGEGHTVGKQKTFSHTLKNS